MLFYGSAKELQNAKREQQIKLTVYLMQKVSPYVVEILKSLASANNKSISKSENINILVHFLGINPSYASA